MTEGVVLPGAVQIVAFQVVVAGDLDPGTIIVRQAEFGPVFSLAYVILPVSDRAPAEAIGASLGPFQRGSRGTLPDSSLAFDDETDAFRGCYETSFIFSETDTGGMQIEGSGDTFYLDTQKVRNEMKRLGLRRWKIRFADEMEIEAFFERFSRQVERHPDTGAFGRWLNPIGQWDWWDLGGRFDGQIIGDQQVRTGRSVAEVSSGPSPGRALLNRLGDMLSDALGQERLPVLEVRNDLNIEMIATLLEDARAGRENAFPATLVLPPGTVEDRLRWLQTWPEMRPRETFRWLGLAADASWNEIVASAYARFEDHWAAGVAYHH